MNKKEIIGNVFQFKELGFTPHWFFSAPCNEGGASERMDLYYGGCEWRKRADDYIMGTHIGFINAKPENGFVKDTFGTLLLEGNVSHVVKPVLEEPTLKGYRFPKPEDMADWRGIREYMNVNADKFQLWGLAMGLFERSWFMRGMDNFMTDLVLEPEFVEDLLDGILEVHLQFMDMVKKELPIDAYYGGDDVSDQRGVMFGVDRWRHFFKPRLKKLIDHAHGLGLKYVLHACGNVMPIVDDLIELGLDGLESLQPEAMDVFMLKKQAKGKLVLIGGMGVQSMLFSGTPDEIRDGTTRLLRELGEGGGYIISPSKPFDCEPVENIAAFMETVLAQHS